LNGTHPSERRGLFGFDTRQRSQGFFFAARLRSLKMPRKPIGDRPMTQSERNRKLRESRLKEGLSELRGAFVPTELHAQAKQVRCDWLKSIKSMG
jgi:hypothetical protein